MQLYFLRSVEGNFKPSPSKGIMGTPPIPSPSHPSSLLMAIQNLLLSKSQSGGVGAGWPRSLGQQVNYEIMSEDFLQIPPIPPPFPPRNPPGYPQALALNATSLTRSRRDFQCRLLSAKRFFCNRRSGFFISSSSVSPLLPAVPRRSRASERLPT